VGPVTAPRLVAIALLAFAAGCASTTYRDPTLDETASGPTARLIVRNQHSAVAALRTFDDAASCRKPLLIPGAPLIAAGEEADVGVRAGHDFTLEARTPPPDSCAAIVTFRPEAGRRYLAQFTGVGTGCALKVVIVQSVVPPRVVSEPTSRNRSPSPAGGEGGCSAE
jgi:hypothetical protein